MKKAFFLVMFILFSILTAFVASTIGLGMRSGASGSTMIVLLVLEIVCFIPTILFYKLYKQQKGGNK